MADESLELARARAKAKLKLRNVSQDTPTVQPEQPNNISKTESALRGAAQTASLGFQDELSPYIERALAKVDPRMSSENYQDMYANKPIKALRNEYRRDNAEAYEANPGSFISGGIVGGLPLSIATGGTASPLTAAGVMGGVAGLGSSEAEDAMGMAKDTALGAGLGIGSVKLGQILQKYGPQALLKAAPKLAEKLGITAESLAENATGATAAQLDKFKPGSGRKLLDRGVVKFGSNQRNIEQEAARQMAEATGIMDDVLTTLGKSGREIDPQTIVSKLDDEIAKYALDPSKSAVRSQLQNIREEVINSWVEGGGKNISPVAAEETKRGFQSIARKAYGDPDRQIATKSAGSIYRQAVEDTASELDPVLAKNFTDAKETFGLLDPVQEAAERRANVMQQSPGGGFGDVASAAAGEIVAPGGGGFAMPLARRFLGPRLSSALAVTADKTSKILGGKTAQIGIRAAKGIEQAYDPMLKASAMTGQNVSNRSEFDDSEKIPVENMGKYSGVLQQAKQQGPEKLAQAHYVLYKRDPEYQKLYNENKKQEEGE